MTVSTSPRSLSTSTARRDRQGRGWHRGRRSLGWDHARSDPDPGLRRRPRVRSPGPRADPACGQPATRPSSSRMTSSARSMSASSWVATRAVIALGRDHGAQQAHDLTAGLEVELAGRLVGDQQLGAAGQRPSDRHPLLLAAGQLTRALRGVLGEPDESSRSRPAPRARPSACRDAQRDADVLGRGQHRDQAERLEDERDRVAPQRNPLPRRSAGHVLPGRRHACRWSGGRDRRRG